MLAGLFFPSKFTSNGIFMLYEILLITLPKAGSFLEIIVGIVLFLIGIIGGYRLGDS